MDYGMKEQNPTDNVLFHGKADPSRAVKVRKVQIIFSFAPAGPACAPRLPGAGRHRGHPRGLWDTPALPACSRKSGSCREHFPIYYIYLNITLFSTFIKYLMAAEAPLLPGTHW